MIMADWTHDGNRRWTTTHVVSATRLTDGTVLAMCGQNLGTYNVAATHNVVGNYASRWDIGHLVSCAACREAMPS